MIMRNLFDIRNKLPCKYKTHLRLFAGKVCVLSQRESCPPDFKQKGTHNTEYRINKLRRRRGNTKKNAKDSSNES